MSQADVDVVRRGFQAYQALDMEGFTRDWHPQMRFDVSHYEGWPGDRTQYVGADEILAAFAELVTGVRGITISDPQLFDLGDGRVLALYVETQILEGSRREIDIGIIYRVGDGKLTEVEVFTGHDRARRAAGLAA